MEQTTKKAPGLFEGTARYYSRYRFGYPADVWGLLCERFGLGPTTPVLDLGCGTGQISIPLAERGIPVHAVDPDVDMLAEGLRVEAERGVSGIAWRRGDDKSLERLHLPEITICIMGASFHWTDRDALLLDLDNRIAPHGGIALVNSNDSIWSCDAKTNWRDVTTEVVQEFLGPKRRAGGGTYTHPDDRHETVLRRSPFSQVTSHAFTMTKILTIDDIIGLQFSTSYASPAQLGDRIDQFRGRLHDRLADITPDGSFTEDLAYEVLLARR